MSRAIEGHYLVLVHQIPKLSRERERELAKRWRDHADTAARDELVQSQLRHVVAIARRYRRDTGATLQELIAEGNFGLLRAMKKFDADRGTRLVTYAAYWIRAYISQYVIRSRSLVATGVQSKLLSKIRRERAKAAMLSGEEASADKLIAAQLALSPDKLRSLTERLDVRDLPWDINTEDVLSARFLEAHESPSAEESSLSREARQHISVAISCALSNLDERERYIVKRRLMAHRDEQLSLAEIGRRFRVSRERARQIEARALRKLKVALIRSPAHAQWLAHRFAA
jgi:RNA polymerase sigma-32 factor